VEGRGPPATGAAVRNVENACHEGNDAMKDILSASRPDDRFK
jgi:hypothetical protein